MEWQRPLHDVAFSPMHFAQKTCRFQIQLTYPRIIGRQKPCLKSMQSVLGISMSVAELAREHRLDVIPTSFRKRASSCPVMPGDLF
jgi:hypothetical protein